MKGGPDLYHLPQHRQNITHIQEINKAHQDVDVWQKMKATALKQIEKLLWLYQKGLPVY